MKRIPLHAADGSVRAHALVDDDDYDRINVHRRVGMPYSSEAGRSG